MTQKLIQTLLKEAAVCQSEKQQQSKIYSLLCRAAQVYEVQALKLEASATL